MKLALVGLVTIVFGSRSAAFPSPQQSADERAIRALEEKERLAVLAEDTTVLRDIWAPSLIVNNPQNEISANRAVVFGLIVAGRIRHARFERRIEAVRISGDIAIVMGGETVATRVATASGPPPIERRFSHTWRRIGATWQLIARHANRIPPS